MVVNIQFYFVYAWARHPDVFLMSADSCSCFWLKAHSVDGDGAGMRELVCVFVDDLDKEQGEWPSQSPEETKQ